MTPADAMRGVSLDRGSRSDKTFAQRLFDWAEPEAAATTADQDGEDRQRRRRQAAERAITAALRSIAEKPDLPVLFDAREPAVRADGAHLPPLPAELTPSAWRAARGRADGLALALRYRAPAAEAGHRPGGSNAAAVFEVLQQARAEALGVWRMPGIARNLAAATADRLARLGIDAASQPGQVPPLIALAVVARAAFEVPPGTALGESARAAWAGWAERHAPGALAGLADALGDAERFAEPAAVVAQALAAGLPPAEGEAPAKPMAQEQGDAGEPWARIGERDIEGRQPSDQPAPAPPVGTDAPAGRAAPADYRAYTTAHDRVVGSDALASAEELVPLRAELEGLTAPLRPLVTRLANRLQRRLLARQRRAWLFDLDEGLLDAGKLDRVVATPGSALSFKQEAEGRFQDTVVSLLIDNSGSMRGRSIALAALCAEIIGAALSRCGVATEILGFTTQDFRGGQSARDWARAGRPANPGRLADLLHIVYKRADQPFRQTRDGLALMLKPGLLKENVDGEALDWAAGRLRARAEPRKLLMVISDGAPNDQTTAKANDPGYLDRHLRAAIARLERDRALELVAIGIGHDVGGYYRHAVTLPDAERLGEAMIGELAALLDREAD